MDGAAAGQHTEPVPPARGALKALKAQEKFPETSEGCLVDNLFYTHICLTAKKIWESSSAKKTAPHREEQLIGSHQDPGERD